MKLSILGGGGFRVPLVFRALSSGRFAGLITDVALFDSDPRRLAAMERVLASMPVPDSGSTPTVSTCADARTALDGTDMVFAAIRAGSTAGRVLDERIAMKHGLLGQETTGVGGIAYALRSIPQMLALGRDIADVAPGAWLINFTNPAGMVTEALQPLLGERVIGICDSPISLVRRAALAAGVPLEEGSLSGVDYVGLNHLGWLRGLTHDGKDHLPALLADPARLATFEEGRIFGPDLPRMLGCLPNEYLFYYYFQREATLAMAGARQTRGEFIDVQQRYLYEELLTPGERTPWQLWDAARRSREEGYLAEARTDGEDRDETDLLGGGYERVALSAMESLLTGKPAELILNVRNGGLLAQLPADAVVELPSRIDGSGATPLPTTAPTLHQQGLMSAMKAVEQLVVRAAVTGDYAAAREAIAIHPLVDSFHSAGAVLAEYQTSHQELAYLR
ncbi:6-phospho-beta-glucosidase [Arthrobacter roseus]|uniref:6-phospho-beta-glucosidase n=1 Tax=Arthrobacter roseus TaxID=136274 RepID=UPI00196645A1|nr:6-phospho-beta-glucosidase [Arthrobacter roseus]MBM7849272.1 6-phospho-beta-glucosidase [Arthrobacter roseus]